MPLPHRLGLFCWLLTVALTCQASGQAIEKPRDWFAATELDRARELAADKETFVTLLLINEDATNDEELRLNHAVLDHSALRATARVFVGARDFTPEIDKIYRPLRKKLGGRPVLMITTPEGELIGVVRRNAMRKLNAMLRLCMQTRALRDKGEQTVEKAEGLARRGRFENAVEEIADLVETDRRLAALIRSQWFIRDEDSSSRADRRGRDRHRRDDDAAAEKKPEKEEDEFDPDQGPFWFQDLEAKMRERFEAIAAEQVAEAEAAMGKGDEAAARRILRPMIRQEVDLKAIEKAKALWEKLNTG